MPNLGLGSACRSLGFIFFLLFCIGKEGEEKVEKGKRARQMPKPEHLLLGERRWGKNRSLLPWYYLSTYSRISPLITYLLSSHMLISYSGNNLCGKNLSSLTFKAFSPISSGFNKRTCHIFDLKPTFNVFYPQTCHFNKEKSIIKHQVYVKIMYIYM